MSNVAVQVVRRAVDEVAHRTGQRESADNDQPEQTEHDDGRTEDRRHTQALEISNNRSQQCMKTERHGEGNEKLAAYRKSRDGENCRNEVHTHALSRTI